MSHAIKSPEHWVGAHEAHKIKSIARQVSFARPGWFTRFDPRTGDSGQEKARFWIQYRDFYSTEPDVNWLDMQEYQGVVTRAKTKQVKNHKDQIEQEKFQGLNFDVQDLMELKF
ncbi:hypothetical protein M9H77_02866 [Catharanthus roseus]|uniref:Uncharacterized protein n=1 Tax=Catharanthus roseus TaxID=4058 RepID=A0ACC0C9I8_CATRO|nr:hypothetical protein M9H77_02866 [Catharanthus roseus]